MKIKNVTDNLLLWDKLYSIPQCHYTNSGLQFQEYIFNFLPVMVREEKYSSQLFFVSDIPNKVVESENALVYVRGQGMFQEVLNKFGEYVFPVELNYGDVFVTGGMDGNKLVCPLERCRIKALGRVFNYMDIETISFRHVSYFYPKVKILCYKRSIANKTDIAGIVRRIGGTVMGGSIHASITNLVLDKLRAIILESIKNVSEKACAYCIENKETLLAGKSSKLVNKFYDVDDRFRSLWDLCNDDGGMLVVQNFEVIKNFLFDARRFHLDIDSKKIMELATKLASKYVPVESPYNKD